MPNLSDPGHPKRLFANRLGSTWKDLADYFDVKSYDRARWAPGDEPRELWDHLEQRARLTELPAALAEVGRPDLVGLLTSNPSCATTPAGPASTAHPSRSRVVVAAGAAAVLLAAGAGAWRAATRPGPAPVFLKLHTATAPPAVTWDDTMTCDPRTQWPNTFPSDFAGEVYVQFTADPRKDVSVRVTLEWGGLTWRQTVPAKSGDAERRLGGTMLVFEKRAVDDGRPARVTFETDIPVCAAFGTAADAELAAPSLKLTTPGWH